MSCEQRLQINDTLDNIGQIDTPALLYILHEYFTAYTKLQWMHMYEGQCALFGRRMFKQFVAYHRLSTLYDAFNGRESVSGDL